MIRSSEPSPHAAVPPQLDKVCCRQTGVPGRESTKVPSAAAAAAECPSSFFGRNSGLLYSSKVSLVVLGPYFFFFFFDVVVFLSLPSVFPFFLSFPPSFSSSLSISLYLSSQRLLQMPPSASVRPWVSRKMQSSIEKPCRLELADSQGYYEDKRKRKGCSNAVYDSYM